MRFFASSVTAVVISVGSTGACLVRFVASSVTAVVISVGSTGVCLVRFVASSVTAVVISVARRELAYGGLSPPLLLL